MPSPRTTWLKMTVVGIGICVGGPALVQYLRPTDQELFNRFSPDIQQRSLEDGPRREQEFDNYVRRLKEWSKSDKSIWVAAQEEQQQRLEAARVQREQKKEQTEGGSAAQREEMRRELLGGK